MVTRIEDDPDLLAALSEEEVDAALAEEGIRASGVRAAVRRRIREAEAMPARSPARRTRFNPFMATALAFVGVIALASLLWVQQESTSVAEEVLTYEATLTELMRPPSKSPDPTASDLLSVGAQALLTAAQADPPDQPAAREASAAFTEAYAMATEMDAQDTAAFFAGLANGLMDQPDEAVEWLRRVSPDGAYAGQAKDAIESLQR